MKRLVILAVAGSLAIAGATTGLNTVKAAETKKGVKTCKKGSNKNIDFRETDKNFFGYPNDTDFKETDKNFFGYPSDTDTLPSLSEFLKKDTKLTKEEKKIFDRGL